jgi:hypothetical protein
MTTTQAASPVLPKPPSVDVEVKSVDFHGRSVKVRQPTPDQLMAWDRLLSRLDAASSQGMSADEARKLWGRCLLIINSTIADDDDREWLEDRQLDGTVTVEECAQLVVHAVSLYGGESGTSDNRRARRAKA